MTRTIPALRLAWTMALLCAGCATPPAERSELVTRTPAQVVTEAFDSDYGKLVLADVARTLARSAQPQCLRERAGKIGDMTARAREIMIRNGTNQFTFYFRALDQAKLEERFAAKAGPGAKAELLRLRSHPDVLRYSAQADLIRHAKVVNLVTETTGRHALLARVRFVKALAPISSGDAALIDADPTDKAHDALERMAKASAVVARWQALNDALEESFLEATDGEHLIRFGPRHFTPGFVETDLASVCIFPRP